ncbi:DNA-binding response regulator [Nocardioides mangrovicus]|uniref:DNA-binding response regulator n=1 Tax=Nocardioides mangrovicus TaxID=2478913 RepID=A0A3L8P4J1_9ACTN|nr:response regulator transcription factor [Nocardioides mangrovicus]RLV50346.1 DNA-binding response regulator [Nocardioides mangrovicus]
MPRPLTVVLINDYPLVLAGLATMLWPYSHRVQVLERQLGSGHGHAADVALIDTFGSPVTDTRVLEVLRTSPTSRVVVYSWHPPAVASPDLAAHDRFSGFLPKQGGPEELVAALERICAGGPLERPETARPVSSASGPDWPGRDQGLSERESEVLALLGQGLSNEDIASALFLSVNSIKRHLKVAYRKMGVASRTQALLWALDHDFARTGTDAPGR